MKSPFKKLVRFEDTSGRILFGEAEGLSDLVGSEVPIYAGENPWTLQLSGEIAKISKVLSPIAQTPLIYGIGLNYKTHIAEAGWPTPQYPTVFTKPPGALNGPYSDVVVNPACTQMDYEGELAVILGQDCKNVSDPVAALNYVLGYSAANDVSSRYWQLPAISGQQHGYAKSFDGFAPIGPVIVSPDAAGDINRLMLTTKVNGEERQSAQLDDLLFQVGDLIVHLSRATTIKAGTIILTGTPGGVAAFMKPPAWLKSDDEVEVTISNIGTIKNRLVFEE